MISVIMPFYNEDIFLEETILSILNQTNKEWELIAVDDYSTDGSWQILKKYADQDERIVCVKNKKKGIIGALQTGYQMSNGTLISRMDADDIMPTYKLEEMSKIIVQKGRGHVVTGLVKYFSSTKLQAGFLKYEKWLNALTAECLNYEDIFRECVIASPCWLMYRADFDRIGGFNSPMYPEDYDLVFRMYLGGLKVVGIDQILHYWRDHPKRASRNDINYQNQTFFKLKVHYLQKVYNLENYNLILWGAGKKGKALAKELISEGLQFNWMTNNVNKIGHNIYDIILMNVDDFKSVETSTRMLVLMAISQKNTSNEKIQLIKRVGLETNQFLEFI